MYYRSKEHKDLFVTQARCPSCGQLANIRFFAEKSFMLLPLIPVWLAQYYGTCGYCFRTFKLDKKMVDRLRESDKEAGDV